MHKTWWPSRSMREGRRLFEPVLHTLNHPPFTFCCPFKSYLVTQSNLKKGSGATHPSGMVLFSKNWFPSLQTFLNDFLSYILNVPNRSSNMHCIYMRDEGYILCELRLPSFLHFVTYWQKYWLMLSKPIRETIYQAEPDQLWFLNTWEHTDISSEEFYISVGLHLKRIILSVNLAEDRWSETYELGWDRKTKCLHWGKQLWDGLFGQNP